MGFVNSQIKMIDGILRHLREAQAVTGKEADEEEKRKLLLIIDQEWETDETSFSRAMAAHKSSQ
jgi:transcription initiation factor TFIID subunit TAF12